MNTLHQPDPIAALDALFAAKITKATGERLDDLLAAKLDFKRRVAAMSPDGAAAAAAAFLARAGESALR